MVIFNSYVKLPEGMLLHPVIQCAGDSMNLSVVFSNSICSSAGTILCWYDGPSTCKRLQFAIDSMVIEIVDLPMKNAW